MPGLSMKETRRLIEHIQPQGVQATKVKNGLLLRLPNGESTVVHYSVSDHRGPSNLRARLRRAGVTWPTDPGTHTQRPKPGKQTIQKAEAALDALGHPAQVTTRELALAMGMDIRKNGAQVRRYLVWAGWDQVGNTVAAKWLAPLPEGTTDPFPSPAPLAEAAEQAETGDTAVAAVVSEPPAETPPAAVTAPQDREFLDTHDSWTANWDTLPPDTTISQLRVMLDALGLAAELRTWRRG